MVVAKRASNPGQKNGGPQNIELKDKYVFSHQGEKDQELVEAFGLKVTYFVKSYSEEIMIHGAEVVEAILKDFKTGEVEYVKKKA